MIIITTKRKLVKIASIILAVGVLGISICGYIQYKNSQNKLGLLLGNTNVSNKTSLTAFIISKSVTEQANKVVEIFDVKMGKVVKRLDLTPAIESEAKKYLEGMTGVYVKVKAFPEDGFIVRVPLKTPIGVQNQWLDTQVEEVFIIFPENQVPYLLILDERARPRFYNFKGDTSELLKSLDFQTTTSQE